MLVLALILSPTWFTIVRSVSFFSGTGTGERVVILLVGLLFLEKRLICSFLSGCSDFVVEAARPAFSRR